MLSSARPRFVAALATLLAATLVAAGCGVTTEEAEAQLCTDLFDLRANIAALNMLDSDSTVGEIKGAREAVERSWVDVVDSARQVEDARTDDADDAIDALADAIEDVDDDSSVSEALGEVQPSAAAALESLDDLNDLDVCSIDE